MTALDRTVWPEHAIVRHGPNDTGGRDLVVGDIHGYFDTLEHALDRLKFNPAADRLFAVGDLIDRGPQSAAALEWLVADRIAAVRGNHDQGMVDWRYLASFAQSPVPSSPIRPAACAINASTCSGRCSSPLVRSTHSSAPRNVSIAASKASNRSMASVHWRRALRSAHLALRRHVLSRARIFAQSPQRLALALNRRVGAPLQLAPHLVHLVEHMKAIVALLGVGKHLGDPRRNPLRRILDHHRQRQPLPLPLVLPPAR